MNEMQTPPVPKAQSASAELAESTVRPTKRQKELLAYIEGFINEHGYSPSYREIMNGLEYTSVATVALHVGNLIKRGHLRKRDHSARSLEVLSPSDPAAVGSVVLKTNAVKEGEEKWLVGKVEQFFVEAEAAPVVLQNHLDTLYVLLGALRVLDLDGAAQSFMERLRALKAKFDAAAPPTDPK